MKNGIAPLWNKALNLGTSPSYSIYKNRRIRVLNATCIVSSFAFLIMALLALAKFRWIPFSIQLFRAVICLFTVLLLWKKRHNSAVLCFLTSIVISNLLFSWFVPYQTSNSLNYTLVFVFVFYFIPPGRKANIIFTLISIAGCASYYYEVNYLPNTNHSVHLISFLAISLVSYFILSHYQKEHLSYQKQLEIQNKRLRQQNDIISAQSEEIKIQRENISEQNRHLERERNILLDAQKLIELGNWEHDMDTDQLEWSDTTYNILELDKTDFIPTPHNHMQFVADSAKEVFKELYNRLIKEGVGFEVEIEHTTLKKNTIFLLVKAKAERKNGKTTKVLGTLLNITERKISEQKLQQLNDSKDRILSTVAHDLRSPINQVKGLVSILEMQNKEASNSGIFSKINTSCQKGLNLIQELLEISLLEDENFQLQTEMLNLQDIVNSSVNNFQMAIEDKNLRMSILFPEQAIILPLNNEKFGRVLENILSNAIKFTPENEKIIISATNSGEEIALKIQDSGIGIPKELQANLFDKFSKASRTGLNGEKSVGLGMSIIKQIIDLHNGRVEVKSKEGKGTSFQLYLPIIKTASLIDN